MPKSVGGGMPSFPGSNVANGLRNALSGGQSTDSLERRNYLEDSITITYQFASSIQSFKLDSSISDFTKRFPIPAHHIFLGNLGTATKSILFSPEINSGLDFGFHAFDVYRWKLQDVRFFNSTRPYTELAYHLGGSTEQIIEVQHTQNIKPNWNVLFQYRLISSPGTFKNQKTNHNNYLLTSWFQSVNKRYNNYLVILSNRLQAEENGGIKDDKNYLDDPIYSKDRFTIPTQLGIDAPYSRNFIAPKMSTGNRYNDFSFSIRQQYDFGKKDSLVSDSTVIPLFYPRLRFEHNFQYNSYRFNFFDFAADSLYYKSKYGFSISSAFDSVSKRDEWKEVMNEFSIYQYPDAKNLLQFLKAGIRIQNLQATLGKNAHSYYNLSVHGAYLNKTKNKKWDMAVAGAFYLTGLNAGDYHSSINLKRFTGKNKSYLELGFSNAIQTPSFLFNNRSSFYLDAVKEFKKEFTTQFLVSFFVPKFDVKVSGNYYVISNYTYVRDYYKLMQEATLFNLLHVSIEKKIHIKKNWIWNAEIHLQQKSAQAPINVPVLFLKNRMGYEGTLGIKNLNVSFGVESRYHTAYKADSYSPIFGKYFYQNTVTVSNLPDVSGYFHFRIRSFSAFVRAENLNSVSTKNGFGFLNNSLAAPNYPYPGLNLRLGIYWSFVN